MTDQPMDHAKPQAVAHLRLRDGSHAWVRPLRPDDRDELADEYAHLSPQSRRLRFMASVPRLTPAMLTRLVDEVDGVEHVALVLYIETPEGSAPAAIGRIVRYRDVPDAADIAVTVKDAWQGRGVATALLPLLIERRPAGVTHLLTEVAADNPPSLAMLRRVGPLQVHSSGPGVLDVEVDLTSDGMRHAAPEEGQRLHPVLDIPHARCRTRRTAS